MRDTDRYQRILGLEKPWFVKRVDLQVVENRVDIWLEPPGGAKWPCPKCGQDLPCRDHAEERAWRHLDTCQFQTHLYARIPQVKCPEHGVLQVAVPWAEARSRVTILMERFVIDVLRQCATVLGTCRLLRLSWDEVWGVVPRGLARKRQRPLAVIGVDEKAFKKGYQYMTVVCDLENAHGGTYGRRSRLEEPGSLLAKPEPRADDGHQSNRHGCVDSLYTSHHKVCAGRRRQNKKARKGYIWQIHLEFRVLPKRKDR